VLFIFLSFSLFAQVSDTIVQDSVKKHSPKRAAILSMVLPGAGQVYNHLAMPKGRKKAFWKVPLIYAGLGTTTFLLIKNQANATKFKTEYKNRVANIAGLPELGLYNNEAILSQFYTYQSRRDLFILATAIVYGVQILDALVEAHFTEFDVSKDLSLQISPTYIPNTFSGVHFTLKLK
jgi:Family of unknown function (DUF5683)